jgi:hypothetical protein
MVRELRDRDRSSLNEQIYGNNNTTIIDSEVWLTIHRRWFNEKDRRITLLLFPLLRNTRSIFPR